MGGWATVSVRTIDEAQEAQERRRLEREAALAGAARQREADDAERRRQETLIMEQDDGGDDASSAFNPYGGTYKGVQLDAEPAPDPITEPESATAAPVKFSFKKRKFAAKTKLRRKKARGAA